jgi:hypothetical protein
MAEPTYKTKSVDGHEVCFASEWIHELENEIHFNWYYHQAELVYRNCNRNQQLLEIGIGTGLLSDLLRRRRWNIMTLDIDEEKRPDHCASAIDFDYVEHAVDAVLAYEIFEHIPFSTFTKLIQKLAQSKVSMICFSLPWSEREIFHFSLKLPKLRLLSGSLRVPKKKIDTKAHFWELSRIEMLTGNKRLVKLQTVSNLFSEFGFSLDIGKKVNYIQYFTAKRRESVAQ